MEASKSSFQAWLQGGLMGLHGGGLVHVWHLQQDTLNGNDEQFANLKMAIEIVVI